MNNFGRFKPFVVTELDFTSWPEFSHPLQCIYAGFVDNFEYGNFKNLTSKKCPKSGEISSPLSEYSYCRSVLLAGLGKGIVRLG